MTKNPGKPLTPVELFRRGIEITQEIRGRIEEARAYYLGRSSRLRGESAAVEHEFFTNQLGEHIIKTITAEHERTRRQIIKAINTRNIDGLDIAGPRTQECRDQVFAVVAFLANPRHSQNIHHACDRTFRPIKNGYKDQDSLFSWCTRNESRLWAWVETYRLNHDIT